MDKFIVQGGRRISGEIKVSGAKNVAMKILIAGLMTDKPIYVKNIPFISSVMGTAEMIRKLGIRVDFAKDHTVIIDGSNIENRPVPLEFGELYRTATMVFGPLLARFGKAKVPNPGGCRIGRRPIDRHIEGLMSMGAEIDYKGGYFVGKADHLHGTRFTFASNTHTGTETLILAAVLAQGETVLENAAEEPEIDDLIRLLNLMGAKIRRTKSRTIVIQGVKKLSGAEFEVMPDRNEVVTYAIAAISTGGDIIIQGAQRYFLGSFLQKLDEANAGWEPISDERTRFFAKSNLHQTKIMTRSYPGFMTDWQAPWGLLMTQAKGTSIIHETIYEDRFGYITELHKMGAKIDYYDPHLKNPSGVYNFNWQDKLKDACQAIRIYGPTKLHEAILEVSDLRAGATLVLGALCAEGESVIKGLEHIDRGYEYIEDKLTKLGASIKRVKEEE